MRRPSEHLTRRTHLLLSPSMAQRLEVRSVREGRSMASLIREAIQLQEQRKVPR